MSLHHYVRHLETLIACEADAQRRGILVAYKRYLELAVEETRQHEQMEVAV